MKNVRSFVLVRCLLDFKRNNWENSRTEKCFDGRNIGEIMNKDSVDSFNEIRNKFKAFYQFFE